MEIVGEPIGMVRSFVRTAANRSTGGLPAPVKPALRAMHIQTIAKPLLAAWVPVAPFPPAWPAQSAANRRPQVLHSVSTAEPA